MVDVVYNYPKSSCNCYDCGNKDYDDQTEGTPSNLSVLNCIVDKSFDCTNNKLFRSDIEPVDKRGTILINPQVITENFAKDFEKAIPTDQCKGPQYTAYGDSRLVNAARAQITTLDHPPIDGHMKLHELADSKYLLNFPKDSRDTDHAYTTSFSVVPILFVYSQLKEYIKMDEIETIERMFKDLLN